VFTDLEETFEEYKDWIQEEPDKFTKQQYNKALIKLEKVKPYEAKLVIFMFLLFDYVLNYCIQEVYLEKLVSNGTKSKDIAFVIAVSVRQNTET
jgi:ATP/ADP translocase